MRWQYFAFPVQCTLVTRFLRDQITQNSMEQYWNCLLKILHLRIYQQQAIIIPHSQEPVQMVYTFAHSKIPNPGEQCLIISRVLALINKRQQIQPPRGEEYIVTGCTVSTLNEVACIEVGDLVKTKSIQFSLSYLSAAIRLLSHAF